VIQETRIAPKNSLVLIMDPTIGDVPESMHGSLVAATSSCVAVGTRSELDGETRISISDEPLATECASEQYTVFDGLLDTPSKRVSVCTVHDQPIMALDVPGTTTRVQIWANHDSEPDDIRIVVRRNDAAER
jgi:hypothetical protein